MGVSDESHGARFARVGAVCSRVDGDPVFRCNRVIEAIDGRLLKCDDVHVVFD